MRARPKHGILVDMRVFISAGEVSGDRHGASLVHEMRAQLASCQFFGMGHHAMRDAGVQIISDITSHSAIGLFDSIRDSLKLGRILLTLVRAIKTQKPDAIIVIDCEGIHMPLLARVKHLGIPIFYFISPQIWWTRNKKSQAQFIQTLARRSDHIITIFQHEYDLYRTQNAQVHYVGHPLLDTAKPQLSRQALYNKLNLPENTPLIGLFPGSRRQEIRDTYPTLLAAAQRVIDQGVSAKLVVISSSPSYHAYIAAQTPKHVIVYTDHSYGIIPHLHASITTSGTVTLEHACFDTPLVVAYKFGRLAATAIRCVMAYRGVSIRYIALPNLVADQPIVPEFIQEQATVQALATSLYDLCDPHYKPADNPYRQAQYDGFKTVRTKLAPAGAIATAAKIIRTTMQAT